MDKRYQIFISSTFTDLKEERQAVMQALMEMDCIPAGMELFPAADEEQLIFIKKIIDDCDYYVLILGGRYGSVTEDGISYTEKEFDYAVEKGKKVVALIHGAPDQLPVSKSDVSDVARAKMSDFRRKVSTGRMVKFWNDLDQLPGLVVLSLQKTIKMYPAPGWVRGNQAASSDVLNQINELRIENERLREMIAFEKAKYDFNDQEISHGEDIFIIKTEASRNHQGAIYNDSIDISITWDEIFKMIGPLVINPTNETAVRLEFGKFLAATYCPSGRINIDKVFLDTIAAQFTALNYVRIFSSVTVQKSYAVFWQLTENGRAYLTKIMLVKRQKN